MVHVDELPDAITAYVEDNMYSDVARHLNDLKENGHASKYRQCLKQLSIHLWAMLDYIRRTIKEKTSRKSPALSVIISRKLEMLATAMGCFGAMLMNHWDGRQ